MMIELARAAKSAVINDFSQATEDAPSPSNAGDREYKEEIPPAHDPTNGDMTAISLEGSRDLDMKDTESESELSSLDSAAIEALSGDRERGRNSESRETAGDKTFNSQQKNDATLLPPSPKFSKSFTQLLSSPAPTSEPVPANKSRSPDFQQTSATEDQQGPLTPARSAVGRETDEEAAAENNLWPIPDPNHLRLVFDIFILPKFPGAVSGSIVNIAYRRKKAAEAGADCFVNFDLNDEPEPSPHPLASDGPINSHPTSRLSSMHAQILHNSALSNLDLLVCYYPRTALWSFRIFLDEFPWRMFAKLGYLQLGKPMIERDIRVSDPHDLLLAKCFRMEMWELVKKYPESAEECFQRVVERYPECFELNGLVMRRVVLK